MIILFKPLIIQLTNTYFVSSIETNELIETYISVRVISIPAELTIYILVGLFLGILVLENIGLKLEEYFIKNPYIDLSTSLAATIILIVFGAGKLPKVAGEIAKGIKSFKEGLKDDNKIDKK